MKGCASIYRLGRFFVLLLVVSCTAQGGSEPPGDPGDPGDETGAPTIARFDVEPGEGLPAGGGEVTLSWEVSGADAVMIEPGIGMVTGNQATLNVEESTIFKLTASNDIGSAESDNLALVATDGPRAYDRTATTAANQIDAARDLGEIDDVTALRYKVFALHGDSRLPAEFDATGTIQGTPIMRELERRFDALPAEVQSEMQPFRLPPDDPASWYATRETRSTAEARVKGPPNTVFGSESLLGGRVSLIWSSAFSENERTFTTLVIGRAVARSYERFSGLLGEDREPLGFGQDLNVYPIYVINDVPDSSSESFLAWMTPRGDASFIVINFYSIREAVQEGDLLFLSDLVSGTVAHEVFHGFQHSYSIDDDVDTEIWFEESTAVWSENFVYPLLNTEHEYADDYFARPFWSLDFIPQGEARDENPGQVFEYSSYLFHLFVTETFGDDLMRQFWEESEERPIMEAIDRVLGGELAERWSEFAIANWNAGPIRDYMSWDGLDDGVANATDAVNRVEVALGSEEYRILSLPAEAREAAEATRPPTVGVRYLSAQYHHLTFNDSKVRSVLLANGLTHQLARGFPDDLPVEVPNDSLYITSEPFSVIEGRNLRAWALVKNQGEWSPMPYDLTTEPFVAFCQDLPEERVEELVLIYTNVDIAKNPVPVTSPNTEPLLFVSDMACGRWEGTMRNTRLSTPAPGNPGVTFNEFMEVDVDDVVLTRDANTIEEIMEGTVGETVGNYFFSAFFDPAYRFDLTGAAVDWSIVRTASDVGQSCQGDGALLLDETGIFAVLFTSNYLLPNDPDYRSYILDVVNVTDLSYEYTCTPGGTSTNSENFSLSVEDRPKVGEGGASIDGFDSSMLGAGIANILEEWSWSFSSPPAASP